MYNTMPTLAKTKPEDLYVVSDIMCSIGYSEKQARNCYDFVFDEIREVWPTVKNLNIYDAEGFKKYRLIIFNGVEDMFYGVPYGQGPQTKKVPWKSESDIYCAFARSALFLAYFFGTLNVPLSLSTKPFLDMVDNVFEKPVPDLREIFINLVFRFTAYYYPYNTENIN